MKEKSAFITIIGRPNVGKSSLMNRIIAQKVAIVSDKPQTTRTKICGIYTKGADQLVFIDTPGFHKPRNELDKNMNKAVGDGMADVDAALLVVEAAPKFGLENGLPPAERELISELRRRKLKAVLAINKIDMLERKEELLSLIALYSREFDFETVVPVSAKTGDGVDILLSELMAFSKPSPHYFADDDITDQPERVMVAEMIREKLLRMLDKEVPHGTAVEITRFSERDDGIIDLEATIYCEKASHKGIIIGKHGAMLKKIGEDARKDIEEFMGTKVFLQTWVKVKEKWRDSNSLLRNFGYTDT